jgi:hypothetical protein
MQHEHGTLHTFQRLRVVEIAIKATVECERRLLNAALHCLPKNEY